MSKQPIWQCVVCGSSASIMRGNLLGRSSVYVCYAHEYVCSDHGQDPCAVCDTR